MAWRDGAACAGTPIHWWFPDSDGHVPAEAAERCAVCPVRLECHTHALRHEGHGVWAGTSPRDRKRLRRTARITLTPLAFEDRIEQRAADAYRAGAPVEQIARRYSLELRTTYRYLQAGGIAITEPDDWRRQPRRKDTPA